MCGIAGIFNHYGINPQLLVKVSGVIRHRGPDDEGFMVVDEKNTVSFFKGSTDYT